MRSKADTAGFSLIEMALILTIFGAIFALVFKPLSSFYREERRQDSHALVTAAKDGVLGYAMVRKLLPIANKLHEVASPVDAQGQELLYLLPDSPDLTSIPPLCLIDYKTVVFTVDDDGEIDHVAFVLVSTGDDMKEDVDYSARPLELDGILDDIVEYVTMLELQGAICGD